MLISPTKVIDAFVLDQTECCRPIDVLTHPVERQVDALLIVARCVESCDAGARAERFEVPQRSERLLCQCSAHLLLDVHLEDVCEALAVDAQASDRKDVFADDEASRVNTPSDTSHV